MGLSYGEDHMIVSGRFDTVPACDGRMDRQMDGWTDRRTDLR